MLSTEPVDESGGDELEGWLVGVTTRLRAVGITVVDRLPYGGDPPTVTFEGGEPSEEDDFVKVLAALGAKVAYADVEPWDHDDVAEYRTRLRRARSRIGQGFPTNADDEQLLVSAQDSGTVVGVSDEGT